MEQIKNWRDCNCSGARFVEHIWNHLDTPGDEVLCKICGKTVREITPLELIQPTSSPPTEQEWLERVFIGLDDIFPDEYELKIFKMAKDEYGAQIKINGDGTYYRGQSCDTSPVNAVSMALREALNNFVGVDDLWSGPLKEEE